MMTTAQALGERWKQQDGLASYGKAHSAAALATSSWLTARGLLVRRRKQWEVSIALDVVDERAPAGFVGATATRFHIYVSSNEWGFFFCHLGRVSWIRVTDVPFVQECDDFGLFAKVPPLRGLGGLLRALEERYRLRFRREHAAIRSTIPNAEPAIWEWVLADL